MHLETLHMHRLTPGKHGLHIHQAGDLREGCEKLGGHFNPYLVSSVQITIYLYKIQNIIFSFKIHHGGPRSSVRHIGDLGNVDAKEDGVGEIVAIDPLMSLSGGPRGIVGRALVVSENEDDLGQAGNANSLVDGNAGKPVACGIIAYIR
ncbi:hypothetical protein D910_12240 [Dendroctonus ponderosae]|uniref:superoxide dismutase n=1 Tax=Dendroctonus ponderosae TaxID=77166 RepID=U4UR38_DENPD|nr:hypothetical protein D910_12240 [Dendroctonus ponderosae]